MGSEYSQWKIMNMFNILMKLFPHDNNVDMQLLMRNHYYSMNQGNLTLKNNPKEKILGDRHLFQ
jgi:hypothetical protein